MILTKPTGRQLLLLAGLVAVLILLDLLLPAPHGGHGEEAGGHPGFLGKIPFLSAWLGLVGAFVLVLVAKVAGRIIVEKREDYYE
jgi:hypothetical protein